VAKSNRETVPQAWFSDSEGAIAETRVLASDDRSWRRPGSSRRPVLWGWTV